jgi:membrane-associated protease RseP (regulator of RpoE activity)
LAGVRPGDVLVGIDGRTASSWAELSTWIRASGGKDVVLVVTRDGQQLQLQTKVATAQRKVGLDGQLTDTAVSTGFLGVSPTTAMTRQSITSVPSTVWDLTTRSVSALATFPAKVIDVGKAALGMEDRDPNGPVSVVGVSRITGDITSADGVTLSEKVFTILTIAGSVNLFLFLFNLLPIPPLDGGHVASALYEGGRRKVAKWRGRTDPGPVDVARLLPITYAVALVLIAVSVVLVYADLVTPIKLGG